MADDYTFSVGLDFDWYDRLTRLDASQIKSIPPDDEFDHVVVYDDPSGAVISLFATAGGFSDENFTVHGVGGNHVKVYQVRPGLALVDQYDEYDELLTRFLAVVDDPHMYPVYPRGPQGEVGELAEYGDYRLGAIAAEVKVFDSEEEWDAQEDYVGDTGMKMGPTFVASPGLFGLYGGQVSVAEANAAAMFTAICEEVETVTNRLTGMEWYKIVADCGFRCTLALPISIEPAPKPGSVVEGRVVLTGSTGYWGS